MIEVGDIRFRALAQEVMCCFDAATLGGAHEADAEEGVAELAIFAGEVDDKVQGFEVVVFGCFLEARFEAVVGVAAHGRAGAGARHYGFGRIIASSSRSFACNGIAGLRIFSKFLERRNTKRAKRRLLVSGRSPYSVQSEKNLSGVSVLSIEKISWPQLRHRDLYVCEFPHSVVTWPLPTKRARIAAALHDGGKICIDRPIAVQSIGFVLCGGSNSETESEAALKTN